MPTYRVTFTDGSVECILADRVQRSGPLLVFHRWVLVVLTPRELAVRRVATAQVTDLRTSSR